MTDDDSGDVPSYRPTSRRAEAVTIVVAFAAGLAAYFLIAAVPALDRLVRESPVSPSLAAIAVALVVYFVVDGWLMAE